MTIAMTAYNWRSTSLLLVRGGSISLRGRASPVLVYAFGHNTRRMNDVFALSDFLVG